MDRINVHDFEKAARERMEHAAFEYYAGAACDEDGGSGEGLARWAVPPGSVGPRAFTIRRVGKASHPTDPALGQDVGRTALVQAAISHV